MVPAARKMRTYGESTRKLYPSDFVGDKKKNFRAGRHILFGIFYMWSLNIYNGPFQAYCDKPEEKNPKMHTALTQQYINGSEFLKTQIKGNLKQ